MAEKKRGELYHRPHEWAVKLMAEAPWVCVAVEGEDEPLLRTYHSVVMDGVLYFHAGRGGCASRMLGRRAVVCADEFVARIPSWMIDEERGCPATTFYFSAQASGRIAPVTDRIRSASVLQRFMEVHQPEGRHIPISATEPLYDKEILRPLLMALDLQGAVGRAKLGQNKSPALLSRIVEGLWRRGLATDPRAIELVCEATPAIVRPTTFSAPVPYTLHCWVPPGELAAVGRLAAGEYWSDGVSAEHVAVAFAQSGAQVFARDESGQLVGCARAVSDKTKCAWIYDVTIHAEHRNRGLGTALVRLLLDHPAVAPVRRVFLGTRDAQGFYERLGFVPIESMIRPYPVHHLVRTHESR